MGNKVPNKLCARCANYDRCRIGGWLCPPGATLEIAAMVCRNGEDPAEVDPDLAWFGDHRGNRRIARIRCSERGMCHSLDLALDMERKTGIVMVSYQDEKTDRWCHYLAIAPVRAAPIPITYCPWCGARVPLEGTPVAAHERMMHGFDVTIEQRTKAEAFRAERDASMENPESFDLPDMERFHLWHLPRQGYVDGSLTWIFRPTAIGTIVKIRHVDGTELDLSGYDAW